MHEFPEIVGIESLGRLVLIQLQKELDAVHIVQIGFECGVLSDEIRFRNAFVEIGDHVVDETPDIQHVIEFAFPLIFD